MKTRLIYLLLFLSCFGSSCQEKYSEAIILEYFELDKSLKQNTAIIEGATIGIIARLEEHAQSKIPLQFLVEKAREIHQASTDLSKFIHRLKDSLILQTGGVYEEEEAIDLNKPFLKYLPKGARNISLVEQILFSTDLENKPAIAKVILLDEKIQALCHQYIQIMESCWDDGGLKGSMFADFEKKEATIQRLKKELSLHSSKDFKQEEHNNQTWAEFNFKNKPLAAVLPVLRKIQNDVHLSRYMLINFLTTLFSGCNFPFETIEVFAQSSKACIRLGETYEAEIALGAYAPKAIFKVLVNNDTLNQLKGKAIYRVRPEHTGEQHYYATFIVTNPLTEEETIFRKEFYFEVIP